MRKGFTLIEVLVAAGIIAIVALGLLQVHGTNTKLINNMQKRYQDMESFSLVLLNSNKRWHHSSKSLYDFAQKFSLKNDTLRRFLKTKKFTYEDDEFSKVDLVSKEVEEFASTLDNIDMDKLPELKLLIKKVAMSSQKGSGYGYTVELE